MLGFGAWVPVASADHPFHRLRGALRAIESQVADPRDIKLGHLLGTADMIAQMADRCYLEKCRDRLYAEFVLGGVALPFSASGGLQVKYASGLDLLRQTPEFVDRGAREAPRWRFPRRLPLSGGALRRPQPLHGGDRPQRRLSAADPAQRELAAAAAAARRYSPPPPIRWRTMRGLMLGHIKSVWSGG